MFISREPGVLLTDAFTGWSSSGISHTHGPGLECRFLHGWEHSSHFDVTTMSRYLQYHWRFFLWCITSLTYSRRTDFPLSYS
jgi:hypothetical protein